LIEKGGQIHVAVSVSVLRSIGAQSDHRSRVPLLTNRDPRYAQSLSLKAASTNCKPVLVFMN